jgi:hypothetical protein
LNDVTKEVTFHCVAQNALWPPDGRRI